MKFRITLLLAVLLTATSSVFAQSDKPKINVVGVGNVSTFPNAAQITLSLRFVKPTLREAVNENQKTAKEVLTVVKKFAKDTTEIKVSLIATDKKMQWSNTAKKEIFVGFESSQRIIFTLNDLSAMQDFTENILKTRIYEIETVSYFHTDGAEFIKQAQELAVKDAKETTVRLAKASGTTLSKITYLQTNSSPVNGANNKIHSESFQTYGKGMGGEGVSSSGQLLNYIVQVTMHTDIE